MLVLITFQIPAMQQYAGEKIAGIIGKKLGTKVNIGKVDFGIPNHLTLMDVSMLDQQGKEMLKARRLSARIDLLPLAEGRISIATAQLFGAHGMFYQRDSLSQPNFQFALDSLASKDTTNTTPLNLRINSLIMRQSSVSFDRYDLPETPEELNPSHLKFSDISAHIILKNMSEDSLNINIKRLAFKEKSGLQVERLSFRFTGGRAHSHLSDFILRMPGTNFQLGTVEATYAFKGEQLDKQSLSYHGSISPSTVTLSDLACFLPSLQTFNSTLSLSAAVQGKGEDVELTSLLISSTTGDIDINMDGWINNLTSHSPSWQANINDLALTAKTVNFISSNLEGKKVDVPPIILRMGDIHLKGYIKGEGTKDIQTQGLLNAGIGNVALNFMMDKQRTFKGYIDTDGINLRQLLDNDRFGTLATKIDIDGRIPSEEAPVINAVGKVNSFDYNGYNYKNIDINGSYNADIIIGKISIDDPNIVLTAEGSIETENKTNIVDLKATVQNLAPQTVMLSDKWGDAHMKGELNAHFSASSLNDAVGTIDISDFSLASSTDDYKLQSLHIESGYDQNIHFVSLRSDFAEADIQGDFDYETLAQSFTNFLAEALPTLPGLPPMNATTHNNFAINAKVVKSDWLQSILQIPVRLIAPLELEGTVNDKLNDITLECDIPSFFYKDGGYRNGHVSISSPNDSLSYDLKLTKLSDEGPHTDLHVFGKAANNNLYTSLAWDNHAKRERMSGQLNAVANFMTSSDNKQTAQISIKPSTINIHNSDWSIEPSFITYSDNYLNIKDFTIKHGNQHLIVNGIASEKDSDSIMVDLKDIDVEYVLQIVDFDAVDFNGYATGVGTLRGIFGELEADAKLTVNKFEFQHGRMGTLQAEANWNKEDKQIDIHAICNDGEDAMTYVDGYVSPDRDFIDLAIRADGTHLDFAHSFTESFISTIGGHAQGAVRLAGPLDAINLTGQLVVNGEAHVKTLGCTYTMRNDTLKLVPNEIMLANCPIYDIHDNQGVLTGGIHHKDLTELSFDIYAETQNLMVYDFPDFGEDTFYGTIYAQGTAGIHGHGDEVIIETDVTPLKNSVFVYNAAAPDAINNQEFIVWNTPALHAIETNESYDTPEDSRTDIILRMKINATPDATVRLLMDARTNDYITFKGRGDLQATYYNKGGLDMFGNYEVTNGTYDITIQNIIRKNFTFKEGGTIVFNGNPYDASLDLQAQYIVNGVSLSDLNVGRSFSNTVRVNCLMNITGQPKSPLVDFDLDILNVNSDEKQMVRSVINGQEEMRQQVVYLLAIGRFYPQGANNATESETERSNTSLAMQSLLSGTLSGQINNMLGQLIKSNNWNFGANISTGDEGWNNAEYEGLISGRLLNNRLLINGQFGYRDNATTATPSFIGDFDIRYLLYPSGNLALKVYNQSNDRYFTKSSLNTQGIGIIMKKDFNGWRDLFSTNKKKKNQQTK